MSGSTLAAPGGSPYNVPSQDDSADPGASDSSKTDACLLISRTARQLKRLLACHTMHVKAALHPNSTANPANRYTHSNGLWSFMQPSIPSCAAAAYIGLPCRTLVAVYLLHILKRRQHAITHCYTVLLSLQAPLVGELGQSTIQKVLSHTENPSNAIREIQIKASLRNPHCRPLLSLLDELGVTRCKAKQALLLQML